MDPDYNLQDVVRCHLCETPAPPLHCVICNIHLCEDCKQKHLSDKSKKHKVVPFKYRGIRSLPKCRKHFTKICERYCEQCEIPMCAQCVSSMEHQVHDVVDIFKSFKSKTDVLKRDLQELETFIYPKYEKMKSNIPVHKAVQKNNSQKLTKAIDKHGEDLHNEINAILKKLKYNLAKMDSDYLTVLNKQKKEIKNIMFIIKQCIEDIKKSLESNSVSLALDYKSRNAELKMLPPKLMASLPYFSHLQIDKKQLFEQVGSLSALSIKVEEHSYTVDFSGVDIGPLDRWSIEKHLVNEDTITKHNPLRSVFHMTDEYILTYDNIVQLYNIQGELVKSIQTQSGNEPDDMVLTRNGTFVYTDNKDRTINLVEGTQVETVIRLQGWRPQGVCCSSSGDLLVVTVSDDYQITKVVRYSGSTEKQSIQYNDKGKPLYSSRALFDFAFINNNTKYITENKNLDICVSDCYASAVVVVNHAGQFRFEYTSTTKRPFYPTRITTDSQSRILTADADSHWIHILDQDGQFLRYIDNRIFDNPCALCVDSRDNILVVDSDTCTIKKIQYIL